jgi:hypothetical protein
LQILNSLYQTFFPSQEQIEKALESSVEFPRENTNIPTNRFSEKELTVYLFGNRDSKKAQLYGDFLTETGITEIPILVAHKNHVDTHSKPFPKQLWLGGLDEMSSLFDDINGNLPYGCAVHGIKHLNA